MAQLTNTQITNLVFIPFPDGLDAEDFSDFDSENGLSAYIDTEGGIIVSKENESAYLKLVADAAEELADE